jgi:hypothetical protein
MADNTQLDLQGQITRIDRAIAETAKYVAEQRRIRAEAENFASNQWWIVVTWMVVGAALFGAGAVFAKLLIG